MRLDSVTVRPRTEENSPLEFGSQLCQAFCCSFLWPTATARQASAYKAAWWLLAVSVEQARAPIKNWGGREPFLICKDQTKNTAQAKRRPTLTPALRLRLRLQLQLQLQSTRIKDIPDLNPSPAEVLAQFVCLGGKMFVTHI